MDGKLIGSITVTKADCQRQWPDKRAFDLGCGNGATCHMWWSALRGSAYDDLAAKYGKFPLAEKSSA
jgi:hypothetical protein